MLVFETCILKSGIQKYQKYEVDVAMAILFKIIGRRKQENGEYVAIGVLQKHLENPTVKTNSCRVSPFT